MRRSRRADSSRGAFVLAGRISGTPALADRGLGVIIISHNLEDVLKVADSIAVLRLGVLVAQPRKDEVSSRELVELITTGRSGTRFPGTPIQSDAASAAVAH